jgi:hypothetical protein
MHHFLGAQSTVSGAVAPVELAILRGYMGWKSFQGSYLRPIAWDMNVAASALQIC